MEDPRMAQPVSDEMLATVEQLQELKASMDKGWAQIYEMARVPVSGPRNREERRRVEKVLRKLEKRGLIIK